MALTRLLHSNVIFGNALSPRSVVDEAGGFCPELRGSDDIDLWIRIVERGYRVVATRLPLAVYRGGSTSLSADFAAMSRDKRHTYRRALERGNLTWRQRRLVHRRLRLRRAYEAFWSIEAERRDRKGRRPYGRIARSLPLFLLVAAEHPHRWLYAARLLLGGDRGSFWEARKAKP